MGENDVGSGGRLLPVCSWFTSTRRVVDVMAVVLATSTYLVHEHQMDGGSDGGTMVVVVHCYQNVPGSRAPDGWVEMMLVVVVDCYQYVPGSRAPEEWWM